MNFNSNLPAEVASYIEATRLILPISLEEIKEASDEAIYKPMFDYIHSISKKLGIKVSLELVYTDSLKSEAISIDNKMFIIHDRYFGQTINMLNRLFLYKASKRTNLIYFHKIASQMFSRYGFYEESVFAAQQYQSSRDQMDHKNKQIEDGSLIHGVYTHIQELYILLHEFAHLVFKENTELLAETSKDVIEWIKDFGEKESSDERLKKLLSSDDLPEDELIFLKKNWENIIKKKQLSGEFCNTILDRKDLVEEFCCDRLAIIYMIPYLENLEQFKPSELIKSIILCFLHIRTLQLLEARCSSEDKYVFEEREDLFNIQESLYGIFYNARLHHMKDFCYELFLSDEDELSSLHEEVSNMMYSHTDEIFSIGEKTVGTLLYDQEIRGEMKEQFEYITKNLPPDQTIRRYASALLHNVPNRSE